jgi:hypothetical protein
VPTAARDPVFWLHHCNIDRYWECWIRKGGGRANPGSPWTEQTFPFRTTTGRREAVVGDCGRTADLGYTYDNLPCAPPKIWPGWLDELKNLHLIPLRVRPPRPIPDPWPWAPVIAFEPIVIDGRPTAAVLRRADLTRAKLPDAITRARSRAAVVLQDVQLGKAAAEGGFFIDVYLAPTAATLKSGGLKEATRVGSFSSFDLSVQEHREHERKAGEPPAGSPLAFELPDAALRVLLAGRGDPVVVFVRRGLVDQAGKPLPFDQKAELFRIGAMRIEVAR